MQMQHLEANVFKTREAAQEDGWNLCKGVGLISREAEAP
jgi:hypothetical protein